MFTNYLRFGLRNIQRNKAFSLLNIIGLTVSLAAFFLMAIYIEDELSFDRFHARANRIFRVVDDKQTPDVLIKTASTAGPVAPAILSDFPEIEAACRVIPTEALIKNGSLLAEERKIFYADPALLSIFSFDLASGDRNNALKNPDNIILTENSARKYFNSTNVLGQTLLVNGKSMLITGILKQPNLNSHLAFDFLISMSTALKPGTGYDWLFTNWYSNAFYTYILLKGEADAAQLVTKFKAFDQRHDEAGDNTQHRYGLEKLTDIYLRSERDKQAGPTGSITNIYIFASIAVFMLVIACINFINLSTASAIRRSREVGIKKVVGASRPQLIRQFMIESFMLITFSSLMAYLLALFALPAFNNFTEKSLTLTSFSSRHLVTYAGIVLFAGLFAGAYPAFVLSAFRPTAALKGKSNSGFQGISLRKALVVFQFSISILLIVCSAVVYLQMQHVKSLELGFTKDQIMVINFEGDQQISAKLEFVRNELQNIPGVKGVTASSRVPGDGSPSNWSLDVSMPTGDTIHTELPMYLVDPYFLIQYEVPVIHGRGFTASDEKTVSNTVLLNQTALRKLGFVRPEDAIGTRIAMYPTDATVIGVVRDFHIQSLQQPVDPLVLRVLPQQLRLLSVKLNSTRLSETVRLIEEKWKTIAAERPLEFTFLDDTFNNQYIREVKFGKVFAVFTVLAILIASLGLFGLAAISVSQRTKEIGVRKVLGASVGQLSLLVSKHFLLLVIVAIVIASPLAWFAMDAWLQNFAYRITIGPWVFVFASAVAIGVAFLTVSVHSFRAATTNPAKTLKSE